MRKVVVYELLSLDGVAEQPDDFVTDFDDVMRENLGRVVATQEAVLLGRRTYDEWAAFWPTSDSEPFASFINGVEKFVATSTTPAQTWANTTVIDGDLPEFVSEQKRQSGGDIGVHGSIALAQSLLEAGMVDELRLVIAPAVRMHGRKLFDKALPRRLTLDRPSPLRPATSCWTSGSRTEATPGASAGWDQPPEPPGEFCSVDYAPIAPKKGHY